MDITNITSSLTACFCAIEAEKAQHFDSAIGFDFLLMSFETKESYLVSIIRDESDCLRLVVMDNQIPDRSLKLNLTCWKDESSSSKV